MVFTQEIQFDQIITMQKAMKNCEEHPECNDCPLKDNDAQLQGGMTRCETGRTKHG